MQTEHMTLKVDLTLKDQTVVKCDICDYTCRYNIQLKKHMAKEHEAEPKYKCKECEYATDLVASTWEHMLEYHPDSAMQFTAKESENFILKIVAEQTTSLTDEMTTLKTDMKNYF